MENNEIMNNNEEVIETTTEEIVKAASNGGMKKATTIGLAMIAGALRVMTNEEKIFYSKRAVYVRHQRAL